MTHRWDVQKEVCRACGVLRCDWYERLDRAFFGEILRDMSKAFFCVCWKMRLPKRSKEK